VAAVKFKELFNCCLCRQWILMFQATRGLCHSPQGRGRVLGGRPATSSPDGCLTGVWGRAGLPGSCVTWHKRNKAGIRLGALPNTVQGSLLSTYHAHTHTHTLRVAQWA